MVRQTPIVYTIRGCDACVKLLGKWDAEGIAYEERRADLNQDVLEEARTYGSVVPIVVWPDGRVEQGFEGALGCFI
jgi:glutaredoxin